jgi:ABC-2 type transport system permease protein
MNAPSAGRIFLKTVLARAYPRVVGANRRRSWVIFETVFPLLGTIAMVYVYQALGAPRAYLGFAVLGGAMLAFWNNVLWFMAAQFHWERDNGNLEIFIVSPTTLVAILIGMALGGMLQSGTRVAAVLIIGSTLFGISYSAPGMLPAVGLLALTLGALYCLGMMLATLFLFYGREVWHLANAMQEPVQLLSGTYFPVRALGGYAGAAGSLLPLTLGLDAIRQVLLPGAPQFIPVAWEVLALAVQVVVYAVLAQWGLRLVEVRARRDAKLVTRWT